MKQETRTKLFFNGLNGSTGEYGFEPMTAEEVLERATGEPDRDHLAQLQQRWQEHTLGASAPVKEGVCPWELSQAGWGVIFAQDDPRASAIRAALEPMLDLRREQAAERFRVFEGREGLRSSSGRAETKQEFLRRHGVGPGPVDPDRGMPYFLLLAGSPESLPYSFQYQLDVQFAVGRLYFDRVEDYARYAEAVVEAESETPCLQRRFGLFGVQNRDDRLSELSLQRLVEPLERAFTGHRLGWQVESIVGGSATKGALEGWLNHSDPPALLMTVGHGMLFYRDDVRQLPHQGALVCADWPGNAHWRGSIPQDFYFAGDDLVSNTCLRGAMTFHFACFSAGTPRFDGFGVPTRARERAQIAPREFLGGLPQRLLAQGALAVVGHVDRAWSYSFDWPEAGEQTTVFQSSFERLMKGLPIGYALEHFDLRYAELASDLNHAIEESRYDEGFISPENLAGLWTAQNDARSYVLLGDPATRLNVDPDPASRE